MLLCLGKKSFVFFYGNFHVFIFYEKKEGTNKGKLNSTTKDKR